MNFLLIKELSEAIYYYLVEISARYLKVYLVGINNEKIYQDLIIPADKDVAIKLITQILNSNVRFIDDSILEHPRIMRIIREEKLKLL
jgi:hypothetical protein